MTGSGPGVAHLREGGLLRVEHLGVEFRTKAGRVQAVSDVSFDVQRGETLGLVGESGCGKSTTGRSILQLPPPTTGSVRFDGVELTDLKAKDMRAVRPQLQMIFQDPISSLNPRRRVFDIISEPLAIAGLTKGSRPKVEELMEAVGLDPRVGDRRPHQFSGGQCQRISIARALMRDPKVLICDEPVSALDVSVQAQILNLLEDMKVRYGLTLVFIAHDLAVVKNISDRVAVMYLGKLCEVAGAEDVYRSPRHPYTAALLRSIPVPDPLRRPTAIASTLTGDLPSPLDPPSGCRFRTRCPRAEARCAEEEPAMTELSPGHFAACHFPLPAATSADAAQWVEMPPSTGMTAPVK